MEKPLIRKRERIIVLQRERGTDLLAQQFVGPLASAITEPYEIHACAHNGYIDII